MLEHADPFIIDVQRSWILRDALKEAKKKKFQPRMQMKVSYSLSIRTCSTTSLIIKELVSKCFLFSGYMCTI